MSNFTSLEEAERVYDYYDSKRGTYIDFNPINFDADIEDADAWDSDDWSFQYAPEPPYGEQVEGYPTPVLIYPKYLFKNILDMFGDRFNDLLKEWFESTYGYRVNTVINDYESENFIPYS
jgi:hypothetical protein